MAGPRRSTQLRGSKAAPGPSAAGARRAASIGAFHAGKNYTAKGIDRTGYKPTQPKPAVSPRREKFEGAFQSADILRKRGGLTGGRSR